MAKDKLTRMYKAVCDTPGGNGFRVEHFPELFKESAVDDCQAHVHSFYEILWFQEGEGRHRVDFIDYDVRPGTVFFLSPGQIHHFDHCENYKGISIRMCNDLMKDGTATDSGISGLFLKYNAFHTYDSTPCYHIDDTTAAMLQPLVREMEEESFRQDEFGNIDILKSLLCIFLAKIERYGTHKKLERLETRRPSHLLFVQFRSMVEHEYKRMHTVQEYADRLHVAVRTLHKSVNDCSGKTPLTIITERVMLEAKRMVRYTDLMVKEVAAELGFEDPSYFVKLFKRETGYLPSEFQKMDSPSYSQAPQDE